LNIAPTSAGKNQGDFVAGSLDGDKSRVKAVIHQRESHHIQAAWNQCLGWLKVVAACSSNL